MMSLRDPYSEMYREASENERTGGVATRWTGVDMSTPLLLEVVPGIDVSPGPVTVA